MWFLNFLKNYCAPLVAVLALVANIIFVLSYQPKEIKEKFMEEVKFDNLVLNTIKKNKGATSEEIHNKAMEENPKENAEHIRAMTSYSIMKLCSYNLIEQSPGGKYIEPMPKNELVTISLDKYIKKYDKGAFRREIQDRVSLIVFNNCYKYNVDDIYKKIREDTEVDVDYFKMIIYEGIKFPNQPPYPFDGYIMNEEGKLCHLAALRAASLK